MRLLLRSFLVASLVFSATRISWAQETPPAPPRPPTASRSALTAIPSDNLPPPAGTDLAKEIEARQAELEKLRSLQNTAKALPADDDQKKQIELLQKQMEALEKQFKLLGDEIAKLKKQPAVSADVEKLQVQTATLEARSVQAARRDQELASSIDDLREHVDAEERYGPWLPAHVKELFLPSGNNETPLSIYGALSVGYSAPQHTPAGFSFNEFSPDFFVKLNDWILLEAEISVGSGGAVETPFAQADFIVNDWLTVIAGKFVAPIGWFNERLNNPFINKLPTDPLIAMQVAPAFSMLGVQARGAFYLGCSPIKMEYSAYITNGLNVTPATAGSPDINELANIASMTDTENIISNEKAFGGRIGFWFPEVGLEAGLSGMTSGDYVAGGFEDAISLWAVDLNYHKGNWDVRAEYAMTLQQAKSFAGTPGLTDNSIRRQGIYAQIAYRPRDAASKYLQNIELVYRYSYVDFHGIDPTALDPGAFDGPVDLPVRRQQNEFGINYYFYPRMVLKCAYEINDEPGFHLHDNQFVSELAWGW